MHFKSWVADKDNHRISNTVNWYIKIVVVHGELDKSASSAGLEK